MMRHIVEKFWKLVESDSVRHFIWFYYLPLLAWSVLAAFESDTVSSSVRIVMGETIYHIWVFTMIPATSGALIGLAMRYGGQAYDSMPVPMVAKDWFGLWLQTAGHLCMFFCLLAFVVSSFSLEQIPFSAFAISSYVVGTALLSLQSGRKLWKGLIVHE